VSRFDDIPRNSAPVDTVSVAGGTGGSCPAEDHNLVALTGRAAKALMLVKRGFEAEDLD
jgi:hypothetical protein